MPSVQRGSESRDPPELLLLHFSKCWWLTISAALRLSNNHGVEQQGRGWKQLSAFLEKRNISNIYRRKGAATHEGCGQPLLLFSSLWWW
jgi:hypothetical protein